MQLIGFYRITPDYPIYRLQGNALISESPIQFDKFQNLKFSVIRTMAHSKIS